MFRGTPGIQSADIQVDGWVFRGDPGDTTRMPGPWSWGPWRQNVDRHSSHLKIRQCQGGVGS